MLAIVLNKGHLRQLTLACSLSLFALICHAQMRYDLSWQDIAGPGLWIDSAVVSVQPTDEAVRAQININEVRVGEGAGAFRLVDVQGACDRFSLTSSFLSCDNASFTVASAQQDAQQWGSVLVNGQFTHHFSGSTDFQGTVARGEINMELELTVKPDGEWQIEFEGSEQSLQQLWPLAGIDTDVVVQDGSVNFTGVARPSQSGNPLLDIAFDLSGLGFENAVGTVAGAGLSAIGTLQYESGDEQQRFDLAFQPQGGEALLDFAYLLFDDNARPVVRLAGQYHPERLDLEEFSVRTPGVLSANGSGTILFGEDIYFDDLRFELEEMVFPQAKERYLDSVLARFGFAEAEFEGRIRGVLEWQAGALASVAMNTQAFTMDDPRLSVVGLEAQVLWQLANLSAENRQDSYLSWENARVYDLEIGSSALRLDLNGPGGRLAEPARVPIFDGAINIEAFELSQKSAESSVDLVLLATIEPISLAPLSAALGWPALEGSLAGEIPRIEWVDGVLELGGAMSFDVFDGSVVVDNVSLERPFGVLATFAADLDIEDLDLRQVTSAFEFGEIRGRLSGNVEGLRLLDWQPVAFDAVLQTPRNDRSKHRISQRAVDNLSSLGGGAGAALQQTFLRFFEDFSYDRLGLRCVLRNNICTMSGVEARGDGFYIVKGRGIPRIDVIGFRRQVDWPQLLARLKAATDSGDITIE